MSLGLVRLITLVVCILAPVLATAETLQSAFQDAGPRDGYDKYLELETGVVYTGGLQIGPSLIPHTEILTSHIGQNVRIVGNGAVLDLQGEQLCISYCNNLLDLEDCIVLNGAVRYRGLTSLGLDQRPRGSVRYVTFYRCHDYGIRLQRAGEGIMLENNLVIDTVDTGSDFIFLDGVTSAVLPTGANISYGWGAGGIPTIRENWSYHQDAINNERPLKHFSILCESG